MSEEQEDDNNGIRKHYDYSQEVWVDETFEVSKEI